MFNTIKNILKKDRSKAIDLKNLIFSPYNFNYL